MAGGEMNAVLFARATEAEAEGAADAKAAPFEAEPKEAAADLEVEETQEETQSRKECTRHRDASNCNASPNRPSYHNMISTKAEAEVASEVAGQVEGETAVVALVEWVERVADVVVQPQGQSISRT